jgi:MFS family permease
MNYKVNKDGQKVYAYRWVILALAGLAVIVVNGATLIYAGMAGFIMTPVEAGGQYGLTAGEFTILNSCSYLTGFLFCLVTGTWADRKGIKVVMVVGLAITCVGAIARIFVGTTFTGMFVTSVIFGFGLAALNANSAKMLRLWFPADMINVAMGIYLACATAGAAIFVPLASSFTSAQPVFIIVAVLSVITLIAFALLYKKHPENEQPIVQPVMQHLGIVMKSKNLWIACLVIGFIMAAGAINNGNLVAWMAGAKGVDITTAALVSSVCNITCSVGGILFPAIIRKTHNEKMWLVSLEAACIVGVFIYYFVLNGLATAAGVAVVSCLVGGALPLCKALPAELPDINKEHMGAAGGLHSTMQNAMAFLIPTFIVAPLITNGDGSMNFDMVQYCYIALTALCGIAAALLPKLVVSDKAPDEAEVAE